MHSAGLELTQLTYTSLENSLIRHRGDRPLLYHPRYCCNAEYPPLPTLAITVFFSAKMGAFFYRSCVGIECKR